MPRLMANRRACVAGPRGAAGGRDAWRGAATSCRSTRPIIRTRSRSRRCRRSARQACCVDAKIQAYLGAEPRFPGALPTSIRAVESLGSFVIVRINPDSPSAQDERVRMRRRRGGRARHGRQSTGSCSIPIRSRPFTAITSTTSIAPRPRRRGCSSAAGRGTAAQPDGQGRRRAGESRSSGVAGAGAGMGCRGRGGRRGGAGGRIDDFDQRLARAALGQEPGGFTPSAFWPTRPTIAEARASHRGHVAAPRDRRLSRCGRAR